MSGVLGAVERVGACAGADGAGPCTTLQVSTAWVGESDRPVARRSSAPKFGGPPNPYKPLSGGLKLRHRRTAPSHRRAAPPGATK